MPCLATSPKFQNQRRFLQRVVVNPLSHRQLLLPKLTPLITASSPNLSFNRFGYCGRLVASFMHFIPSKSVARRIRLASQFWLELKNEEEFDEEPFSFRKMLSHFHFWHTRPDAYGSHPRFQNSECAD